MSFTPSVVGLLPSDAAMNFYVSEPIAGGPWRAVSLNPATATVTPVSSSAGRFSVTQVGHGSTSIKVTDQARAMEVHAVTTDAAPAALGPYPQAVRCDGMLYVSGQLPIVAATDALIDGGIREQTRQLFANIVAILEAGGGSLASVVKVTVFLAEWSDFAAFNEAYCGTFRSAVPRPLDDCGFSLV